MEQVPGGLTKRAKCLYGGAESSFAWGQVTSGKKGIKTQAPSTLKLESL